MATSAEHRSIFDLCPNDEALIGLREVNLILLTGCDQATNAGKNCSCKNNMADVYTV